MEPTIRLLKPSLLAIVVAVLAAIAALIVHLQAWGANLSHVLFAFSTLLVTVLGAKGLGRPILRAALGRRENPKGETFISIVLGLFVLEMTVFLGASFQVLGTPFGWIVFGAVLVPAALWECCREDVSLGAWKDIGALEIAVALVFGIGSAVYLLDSCLPPRLYDALEYHLGVPWQWIEHGGFYRIDGNVFSNFPFNIEMLYTFSLLLFPGGELAKLLHWGMGVLVAVGIVALGAHFGNRKAGWLAAFLYYFSVPVRNLSIGANIDLGVGLVAIAEIWTLLSWLERPSWRRLALTGAIAGIALGSKYTCLLILLIPVYLVVVFETFRGPRTGRAGVALRNSYIFLGSCILTFAPWAVKNLVYQGNPVFPLMYGLFGGRSWSPVEAGIFNKAVEANFVQGFRDAGWNSENLWHFFTGGTLVLSLLWVPLFRGKAVKISGLRRVYWLALSGYLLWLALTYREPRFIVPVFPLVLIPFVFLNPFARWTGRGIVPLVLALAFAACRIGLVGAALNDFAWSGGWDYLAGKRSQIEMNRSLGYAPLIQIINGLPPENPPKILFVGEARAFGVRYPVEVSTVFNHSSLLARYEEEGSPESVLERLRSEGFTHILVNEVELDRLYDFYHDDGWNERDEILKVVAGITALSGVRVVGRNRTQRGNILLFALH